MPRKDAKSKDTTLDHTTNKTNGKERAKSSVSSPRFFLFLLSFFSHTLALFLLCLPFLPRFFFNFTSSNRTLFRITIPLLFPSRSSLHCNHHIHLSPSSRNHLQGQQLHLTPTITPTTLTTLTTLTRLTTTAPETENDKRYKHTHICHSITSTIAPLLTNPKP